MQVKTNYIIDHHPEIPESQDVRWRYEHSVDEENDQVKIEAQPWDVVDHTEVSVVVRARNAAFFSECIVSKSPEREGKWAYETKAEAFQDWRSRLYARRVEVGKETRRLEALERAILAVKYNQDPGQLFYTDQFTAFMREISFGNVMLEMRDGGSGRYTILFEYGGKKLQLTRYDLEGLREFFTRAEEAWKTHFKIDL